MKKIEYDHAPWIKFPGVAQILLKMKTTLFVIMLSYLGAMATDSYSQTKLSLDLKNTTVRNALDAIENQSEFFFLYSEKIIDVNRRIDVEVQQSTVDKILDKIFTGTDVSYTIKDRQIVLTTPEVNKMPVTGDSQQQKKTISGKVTDSSGATLPGVSVVVKGTTTGVITDNNGNYSLSNIPENASLAFSFVGMKGQEVVVGNKTTFNITLIEETVGIEEVVAIGYGTMKRRDITGSVSSMSGKEISSVPTSRLDQALQGFVPGLDVVSNGHNPGAGAQILLRGRRSFSASNAPLIILDGFPFTGNLGDVNSSDIVSLDVMKDASSTAIYGSRGANGVIIITTKRGKLGKPAFSIDSYAGLQMIYGRIPFGDGNWYLEKSREYFRGGGLYPKGIDPARDAQIFDATELKSIKEGTWTDWQNLMFQTGYKQRHQLNVNGGTDVIKYNLSGNVSDEEGVHEGFGFTRYNLMNNIDLVISPKLSIGTSIHLSNSKREKEGSTGDRMIYVLSPLGRVYDEDGVTLLPYPVPSRNAVNPLISYYYNDYRWIEQRSSAIINFFADYEIIDGLKYRLNLGLSSSKQSTKSFSGRQSQGGSDPVASIDNSEFNDINYESIITYNKSFSDDHQLNLTAVHSIQTSNSETNNVGVRDIPYENALWYNLGAATTITGVGSNFYETALLSYVGRVFYGFQGKYLISASMRADGASQFSPDNKWGYFPSFALGWTISKEKFMRNTSNWLNNLKLRLSYGVSGNQAISPYVTQGGTTRTAYNFGTVGAFGYRNFELANKSLKWESTEVINLGLDYAFVNNRINGSLEVYKTNTSDLLMPRMLPINTGYTSILENIGSTSSNGVELGLNIIAIDKNDFTWSMNNSFSLNREKIVKLYAGKQDDIGSLWFIGQPINVFYNLEKLGIWQLNEATEAAKYNRKPGQVKVKDLNGDFKIDDKDRKIIGTEQPDFTFQTTQHISYKNWELSAIGYVRWGGMMYAYPFTQYYSRIDNSLMLPYWTPDNPTNYYEQPTEGVWLNPDLQCYIDNSYFKLRQLSLAYNVPKKLLNKMFVNSARLYVTAENPFYWTKSYMDDVNLDPDDITKAKGEFYPAIRTIIFGLNLSF